MGAFGALQDSFQIPVSALVGVLLFRVIFRRPWLAYLAIMLIGGGIFALGPLSWVQITSSILVIALILIVLTRLGLLAFLVANRLFVLGGFTLTSTRRPGSSRSPW